MEKMPVLFVGHGSPMNAIEENEDTQGWLRIRDKIPTPKGILAISAHWYTDGTRIDSSVSPNQVYDMYNFPPELYELKYRPKGSPELAEWARDILKEKVLVRDDQTWGIDHGTWSVLCKMYPEANIPVVQLSIDRNATRETHYQIGLALEALRSEGILIFGSGNVVHNLARVRFDMAEGYPWADEFDDYIHQCILDGNIRGVLEYESAGESSKKAFSTLEHFLPLVYILGAVGKNVEGHPTNAIEVYNRHSLMGALSMTCYLIK